MKRVISTLEEIGYDISILYIRSVKDDAITRNSLRKRKVDSEDLENIYSEVEKNALMYNLEFSEKFVIYDNITSEKITANFDNPRVFHSSTYKTLNKWFQQWINSPVKAASDWKKSEEKNEKTSNVNKINQHKVEIKQNLRVK
jgi:hypothetical protein